MNRNTATRTAAAKSTALLDGMADDEDEVEEDEAPTPTEFASTEDFAKGTWQNTVQTASNLFKRSGDAKKRASGLLWKGATAAIEEWEGDSDTDANGEGLASDLLLIMGTSRKGDVSKIKTVALAVKDHGLDLDQYPNLSKAYAEAIRLTKTAKVEAVEDTAGDDAIAAVAADAPKTASTVDGAIKVALSLAGDFDEFFKVLCDVVEDKANGGSNPDALRAAVRSLASEVTGRNKPAPKVVDADADKAGATAAGTPAPAKKAVAASSKAKPKATPTSASKGDPNKKALPPKPATPAVEEGAPGDDDLFNEVESEDAPTPAQNQTAKKATAGRPKPGVKRA